MATNEELLKELEQLKQKETQVEGQELDWVKYRKEEIKNELIKKNYDAIRYFAYKYRKYLSYEDAVGLVLMGFSDAINAFDFNKNYKFITLAGTCAHNRIKMAETRGSQRFNFKVSSAAQALVERGEEPTIEKIAEEMDMKLPDFIAAYGATHPSPLEERSNKDDDDDDRTLAEMVASEEPNPIDFAIERENKQELLNAIDKCLNDREKKVIQMFFYEQKRQNEISNYLGLSQSCVSRILKQVAKKLKAELEKEEQNESSESFVGGKFEGFNESSKIVDCGKTKELDEDILKVLNEHEILNETEKAVAHMRFVKKKSQTEIGRTIGYTQGYICLILKEIKRKQKEFEQTTGHEKF